MAANDFSHIYSEIEFCDKESENLFVGSIEDVFYLSKFVCHFCKNKPYLLKQIVERGYFFKNTPDNYYRSNLNGVFDNIKGENDLFQNMRDYRNQEMVRIAWRDIAGWADLEETLKDLTFLAEAFISETLNYYFNLSCHLKGTPLNNKGEKQNLIVLGMGKLGAWELNFSSDIDLIFFYEDEGVINGKKSISYSEFYIRIIQSVIKALEQVTPDGFVYRVDTRLRPFGDSGPLAMNFQGMENYYLSQAREWERYAMVKARVVAGDLASGEKLMAFLNAFTYRRYLDYRAFGELRELKRKISQELHRTDRIDNIKLGFGGIREIEFIGQAFQLIRGGQEKTLRERRILLVLDSICQLGFLPVDLINKLKDAYRFF